MSKELTKFVKLLKKGGNVEKKGINLKKNGAMTTDFIWIKAITKCQKSIEKMRNYVGKTLNIESEFCKKKH